MEQWRDIEGYEGLYQVSNEGRVRSLDKIVSSKCGSKSLRKGKIMKPHIADNGYLRVILQNNGVIKNYPLHYLVIKTFIGEKPEGMQINHKDENKLNNSVENLEYCTPKYNCNYGNRNRVLSYKNSRAVAAFDKNGEMVCKFKSALEAENLGYNSGHISSCCNGKRKTHKNLIWKFI